MVRAWAGRAGILDSWWNSQLSILEVKTKRYQSKVDFNICNLEWELDDAERQSRESYRPIPRELVQRRFFQFVQFIQSRGLTVREIVTCMADLTPSTTLRKSDLTEEGFAFIQYAEPRWRARRYCDRGENREQDLLNRWFASFAESYQNSNACH